MKIIYTDVLVIGGGLAGLRIGIGAKRRGHDVIILSLVPPKRSHSAAAQGGMQASLGNVIKGEGDNEDVHFEDTVRGSDWGADQEVVRMFVETAPKAVRELAAWGLPWSRVSRGDREVIINGQKVTITERDEAHGLIAQRAFGGTNKWRTCYVSDGTGHAMLFTMSDQAIANGIPVHERAEAIALIHDGSRTSHTAIMARSLQIPAVVGLHDASRQLKSGQYVLLDGYNGLLVTNPTDQTLFEYGQLVRKQVKLQENLRDIRDEIAITLDGVRITLSANIEQAGDAENVRACGAEGVGLFRTEYLYLNRETLPTEEEQFEAYRKVAAALKPHPVVIRTLDLGGDKFISHLWMPQELNPFLGWRAIRFCLQERDIFRAQLRAILRAAVEGNIKMMYPMISGLEELNQSNELLEECRRELKAENIPFGDPLDTGAMIEIPSAVLTADALAKRVKFFSIGTNDLIQYSLAVDRLNEKIAHLYEPTHPAMVRLIRATVEAGRRNTIWVGVCGEMAGDPALVPLLLGLGVDEISVAISVVPQIKFLIRRLKLAVARDLAEFALNCESGPEILARSQALARRLAPSLFEDPA